MDPTPVRAGPSGPDHDKPLVGTSACLLGEPVRYDGEHKRSAAVAGELARHLRLQRYCPEVGIGLSVPRPPIQVVQWRGTQRVRGVDEPGRDFTDALHAYADRVDEALCGFVLKARSPSCGAGSTPVFDRAGNEIAMTDGAFAARLRQRFPRMPLCDEQQLEDPAFLREFIAAVRRYGGYCRVRGP